MAETNFYMKYTGSVLERPPVDRKSKTSKQSKVATSENHGYGNGGTGDGKTQILQKQTTQKKCISDEIVNRPASRICIRTEERVGIINQYRQPWLRPQTTGHIWSLNERRKKMLRYRSDRPKSSPALRRHVRSAGESNMRMDRCSSTLSNRPRSSQPDSQMLSRPSTPGTRCTESSVEEIVVDKISKSRSVLTVVDEPDLKRDGLLKPDSDGGWTEEHIELTNISHCETTPSTVSKQVPKLTNKPCLLIHASADNSHEENISDEGTASNVGKTSRLSPKLGQIMVAVSEIESENEVVVDDRLQSCQLDANTFAAITPTDLESSRPSRQSSATADRKFSSPLLNAEGMVRRSRKERLRRLAEYYENTRFNRPAESARQKLLRVCKTVRVIAGICLAMKSYVKEEATTQWSLHEMHLNLRADLEKKLAFDLIMFSKLRVTRGSEKLKSILAQKPNERTRPEIEVIRALLRNNQAFTDYQKETQIAFARVMEYQRFEPRRIVLKEGHVASGFYIVLSGTCLVNQTEVDPRSNETFVRTITELTTGQSFGEYSLLHNTPRPESVVCKDEVEVLLINKHDFDDIIKRPMQQKRGELIDFCHAHDIDISASQETLVNQPKAIYTRFYKHGSLITNDVMASDYIYVVKEGTCRVVAEIKEIRRQVKKFRLHERFTMHDESWKKEQAIKQSKTVLANASSERRSWANAAINKLYPPEKKEKTFFSVNCLNVHDSPNEQMRERKLSLQLAFQEPTRYLLKGDKMKTRKEETVEHDPSAVVRTWKRVTMSANALSQKEIRLNPLEYTKENDIKTTFAQLATLKCGMAFGVESLLPGTQPEAKLSLISNGAEVILVSKRLFASNVTSTTLKMASKLAVDYPSIEFTCEVLEKARMWALYKSNVVKEIYRKKLDRRPVLPRR